MPSSSTVAASLPSDCLCVGEMIYVHLLGCLIRLVVAGFLSVDDRILLITAGDKISQDSMCYRHNALKDDSYLGSVRYVHAGIVFVELFTKTRDDVSNLVTSEIPRQECFPGPTIQPPGQTPTQALLHGSDQQPVVVTLEERQFPDVTGSCLCFQAQALQPEIVGSLVTSTQGCPGGSRLLTTYGAVYAVKDLGGVRYALVGNMQEAIEALQTLEEYREKMISLVTPIQQAST